MLGKFPYLYEKERGEESINICPLLSLIAGNLFELLPNISGLSRETERIQTLVAPYIRVDDVSITSG